MFACLCSGSEAEVWYFGHRYIIYCSNRGEKKKKKQILAKH